MQRDGTRRYLRFFGARPEADVEDEITFHLDMRERELIAMGMSPAAARDEARRRFGDLARLQAQLQTLESDHSRSASRQAAWNTFQSDVAFVVRTLVRQPMFTLSVILTLGLSIGANASIFSAVSAYLLRPLPVRNADRLVVVAASEKSSGLIGSVSYAQYRAVAGLTTVFEDAVAFEGWEVALRTQKEPMRGFLLGGSDNYLTALGIHAALGRVYTEQDAATRTPVMVLTDAFWSRAFDRDRGVIGRTIHVNDIAFTVIGVLPPEFRGTEPLVVPDAIVPEEAMVAVDSTLATRLTSMSRSSYRMLAHLKPGVEMSQARSALARLDEDLVKQYPEELVDAKLIMERELRTRPEYQISRLTPWIAGVFFGMVGLALLVACANVTNLLLVRATVRRSEIAIRSAIGATPGRVVRLLLTESIMLGAASLVVAYFLARFCIGWFSSLPLAIDVPISFGLELDWRVFGYAAAISLLAGIISGLAPALMGARAPVSDVLRDGGRTGSAGRGRTRLRSTLVVTQVAVSFVLLVCGGLFIRSARSAAKLDMGFSRERLLLATVDLSLHHINETAGRQVQDRLATDIGALPGVERVALSTWLPMAGNYNTRSIFIDEHPSRAPEGMLSVGTANVTPGYVGTLGLRFRSGRDFTQQDDSTTPPVTLVNRAMAEALWPGQDPIGRRLRLKKEGPLVEVVGLIDNANAILLGEEPRPMMLLPLRQHPSLQTFILTKSRAADPSPLVPSLRAAVTAINPNILVYGVRTMASHLDDGIALFFVNIGATMATAIGILGLLQTIVGLYGVLSYSVAQRAKEFGIRLALGAQAGAMIRDVMRQSAVLVGIGLAVGAVLAFALTRSMGGVLVGVSPTDALAYGGALVVVGGLAMISSYVPAWRASRVEPAMVVRGE